MDDANWLHGLRTDPSPQFSDQLRARLRAQEPDDEERPEWIRRVVVAAATVLIVAGLGAVPAVRASVAQFISLFRLTTIIAIPVSEGRLDRLAAENLDIGTLIGEHVELVVDPGPPTSAASLADASTAAGMTLALPQSLPEHTQIIETAVVGERVLRVTADSQRLQQVMDALGIRDLAVPSGLDGQTVTVQVPPVVMIRYDHGKQRSRLFQARTPQVALPDNINLQALGEIGLRILGLPAAEANQFAQAIDWHSTLIVPVPPNASEFRQVNINGHPGAVVSYQPRDQSPTNMFIWSTPERVFVLVTILGYEPGLAMAESVR